MTLLKSLFVSMTLFLITVPITKAYGNLVQLSNSSTGAPAVFTPPPPPDRGVPGGRKGSGSRGECSTNIDTVLTALMPTFVTSDDEQAVWGLTVSERPTFWFYVPYSLTPEITAEFILQADENGSIIHNTKIPLTTAATVPGVISLRLPSAIAPLEIGKRYYWKFVVHCDRQDPSANIVVDGWVERIAPNPSLVNQLEKATPRERARIYAKQGIWHESVTTLAELRRTYPQDAALTQEWEALLQAVNLKEIASKPIVECCIPEK